MAQPVFESKVPIRFLPEEEAYREADFVITIGGDGTLLKAGLDCVHYGKPVLGVNLGRTGFLATCEVEEMPEKLRLLAEGRYTLDPRGLLLARSANGWQAEAINDVVLFGRTRMHPMDYKDLLRRLLLSAATWPARLVLERPPAPRPTPSQRAARCWMPPLMWWC